jgi:DNA mismatch repair protein MutS2
MRVFPDSALQQLEFDKIRESVALQCQTPYGRGRATHMRIHTQIDWVIAHLRQTYEYKLLLDAGIDLPNNFTSEITKELKLLSLPGASLSGDQFLMIRRLAENAGRIFRWFNEERSTDHPYLSNIISESYYEKSIVELIDEVLEETGMVKDSASAELANIRLTLYRKRSELRRQFEKLVQRLQKLGYLADIEESFMNGRRVLAVLAEQKRSVKGVVHSESDSGKTTFIEPEETTSLNNEIFSLEFEETREVNRILRKLTTDLSIYAALLSGYFKIAGEYDFVRARARFAIEVGGNMPQVSEKPVVNLIQAYHPLLLLYNRRAGKPTIPLTVHLSEQDRILVISGPNAGGKTVTLKTVGILQLMLQSGLLVPVSPDSDMGIFRQLMIHIGDTQNLEFELSTYSSHLRHMKYFLENANGKTMFFIDELGSGSDPNLGGAFAEVILEELAAKRSFGIVTTHYLNLKVMANKVKGIINGAMQFDEERLQPLYKLQVGKPGSSYTFSIAERIGLDKKLISRARKLVDENQYELDRLLNSTEQDLQKLSQEKIKLENLIKENERINKEMEKVMDKERHRQQVEIIKQQNRISEERVAELRDMERRLRAIVQEWRKAEDKNEAIKTIQALLFQQQNQFRKQKQHKLQEEKYTEVEGEVKLGDKVKMKNNRSIGIVKELRGKKAVLQIGVIPITVSVKDLVVVKDKQE